MKKLLLVSVSVCALSGAAYGADMQYKAGPAYASNWTGWYLGIDGGVARQDAYFNDLDFFTQIFPTAAGSGTGGTFGGFGGYNWQERSFVFGFETDFNWIGAKATNTWGSGVTAVANNGIDTQSQSIDWLWTFRGRVGLDVDSTLVYLTGGLAVGGVKNSDVETPSAAAIANGSPPGAVISFTDNTTRIGWTAGVGVEHKFWSNWLLRAEFRYTDLGRTTVNGTPGTCATGVNVPGCSLATYRGQFSNTLMQGIVGIGYKF